MNWDLEITVPDSELHAARRRIEGEFAEADPDGTGLKHPACPKCDHVIMAYSDHQTGCPFWGMLPEHWDADL